VIYSDEFCPYNSVNILIKIFKHIAKQNLGGRGKQELSVGQRAVLFSVLGSKTRPLIM
jgi:hypothetical protein